MEQIIYDYEINSYFHLTLTHFPTMQLQNL